MNLTLIPIREINKGMYRHMTLGEAAKKLGVSETTIRRHAKKAGVQKIAGRTVAGGMVIDASPVPVCVTYSR